MDEAIKILSEAVLLLLEDNAAKNDMLGIICIHLGNQSPNALQDLKDTLKNMHSDNQLQITASLSALSQKMHAALSQELGAPIESLKANFPYSSSPEKLREKLYLIQGGKAL